MDAARLMAILELDDKSFMAAIDGAKAKVGGFDSQMSVATRGLNAASRSMQILGTTAGATGMHMGRLGSAVTSLISAFVANPIYAVVAALASLTAYLTGKYEGAMNAALEKTKALAKAESDLGDKIRQRLGMSRTQDEKAELGAAAAASAGLRVLKSERDAAINRMNEAYDKMTKAHAAPNMSIGEKQKYQMAYANAVKEAEIYGRVYNDAIEQRNKKSRAEVEARQEAQYAKEEKISAIRDRSRSDLSAARGGAGVSVRYWAVDSMTSIGGQIGSQNSPQLRIMDRSLQIQQAIARIQSETRDLLREALSQ